MWDGIYFDVFISLFGKNKKFSIVHICCTFDVTFANSTALLIHKHQNTILLKTAYYNGEKLFTLEKVALPI